MQKEFEELFEAKFGGTFSNDSIKFATKAVMYEGWLIHKEYLKQHIPEFLIKQDEKGE